ncbi:MAG: hypothetical protein IMW93_09410 [Thermoanaerobacteraceae bacterium]|nr:hypothetical protein [Thermoanaerobacteraceae bacterium]
MSICDSLWRFYWKTGEVIEEVVLSGDHKGVFMRTVEQAEGIIGYIYRLFCFPAGQSEPVLAVNLETSLFGTCCLGAHDGCCHYNFGMAEAGMSYEEFRQRALDIAQRLMRGVEH